MPPREIPLTDLVLGDEEINAVAEVLRSGWLTSGARTRAFEERFAELTGAAHAYAVSSCTAALHLVFAGLDLGPGDEVICPDLTFVATANAVRYTGAEPVLAAPLSRTDLTLDPADVAARITPNTRGICLMHYGGYACDLDAFEELAREHGLWIVEDCAHAPLGHGRLAGSRKPLGRFGVAGCFSLFGTKNVSTGEGGLVITDDPELGERIDRMRTHGVTVPTYDRHRKPIFGYSVQDLGFNYRFDDLRAAVGICQLDRLETINAQRRALVDGYRDALGQIAGIEVPFSDRCLEDSAAHRMTVQVPYPDTVRAVLRERGIQTSKHYDPVSSFATYGGRPDGPAAAAARDLVTLPLGPHMTGADVEHVAVELKQTLAALARRNAA
ncbi:MAG: aminotransferase class I/II-fold pyridoxal phosphate-dependent enzyme [Acidobacteria bacterium]|nr:aminotransferase class I/II-fold pyridoxal phosphate-dependent enzyme [Acidobacteriota bacterium]